MKQVRMTVIVLVMLGMVAVGASAGVIYATSDTLLESFNTPALDGRIVREGASNLTDLAADSDDVYAASGGRVLRLPDGHFAGYVLSDWNDYTSVAALPDSYVYAANSNSIWRFNADLTGEVLYIAVSNITDLAVNGPALYGTTGGRIHRFPGTQVSELHDFTSVAVGPDGYVYAFAASSNSIWRFEANLTGGIPYVTGVGGITDLSVDGTVLYGTSGGKIYSFPAAETWGPTSVEGELTSLAVLPEPSLGTGIIYTANEGLLDSFNTPALDGWITLEGIGGVTDLAADSNDVYAAAGSRIYRLPDGHFAGHVRTEWNSYTSVAALPDSYVYAANATSIWRFDADLTGGIQYMAVSGITDIAVNSTSLYGTSGGKIYSFPGLETLGYESGANGFTSVTAGSDGYVYAANSNSIWRFEADLTGGITYVTGIAGITDLSVDGTILYGASGGRIYSFPGLETWGSISLLDDFTTLAAVETVLGPAPEIGDIAVEYLGASGLTLTWNTGIGHNYMVLEKADLTSSTWSTNQSGIPGGAGSVTVTTAVDAVQAFYKVTSE